MWGILSKAKEPVEDMKTEKHPQPSVSKIRHGLMCLIGGFIGMGFGVFAAAYLSPLWVSTGVIRENTILLILICILGGVFFGIAVAAGISMVLIIWSKYSQNDK